MNALEALFAQQQQPSPAISLPSTFNWGDYGFEGSTSWDDWMGTNAQPTNILQQQFGMPYNMQGRYDAQLKAYQAEQAAGPQEQQYQGSEGGAPILPTENPG